MTFSVPQAIARKCGIAMACFVALMVSGCIGTTHYVFGGDEYAVTNDGRGSITVRNLRTGAVVEETSGVPGPFATRLAKEGKETFDSEAGGDTVKGGGALPTTEANTRGAQRSPGPTVRRPRAGPPVRNDYLDAMTRDGGGD